MTGHVECGSRCSGNIGVDLTVYVCPGCVSRWNGVYVFDVILVCSCCEASFSLIYIGGTEAGLLMPVPR